MRMILSLRYVFLSTPSSQRATHSTGFFRGNALHFYPRPLRRGRLGIGGIAKMTKYFYPRPLRRGRRQICPIQFGIFDQFVYKLAAFEPVCVK